MAITAAQQTQILQMTQAMFGAAPGATFLSQFANSVAAGNSVANLAQTLSGAVSFYGKSYSASLSPANFADAFINDLVGSRASIADKAWATTYIVDKMAIGATQADIISDLTQALSSVSPANTGWGAAATYYNTGIAAKVIDNLVGSSATTAAKTGAVDYIVSQMAAGQNLGKMVEWAITALDSVDHANTTWGSAATLFDNRIEVSTYYSVDKASKATDLGTLQQALKAVTTATGSVTTAKAIFDTALTGKIQDGYIKGATVFVDLDGDGKLGAGETSVITDDKGNFILPVGVFGKIIASGGTDISTGKAFAGQLTAPAGSTTINPLTTLQQGFVEKGQSADEAELTVAKALGLDAGKFDLTTFDPLAAALDPNASAEERALGAQLQGEAAKIANFLVAAGKTLEGAAGGTDKLDAAAAGEALLESLVNAIGADSDGVISFSDKAMLESIMNESVTLSGDADLLAASTKIAGLADNFAAASAASADSVDKAFDAGGDITAMIANMAQAQVVAQGDMADKMLAAAASGDFTAVDTGFTGTAFEDAANEASIGDLNPDSTADDAATDASNTDADAEDTDSPTDTGSGGSSTSAATFTVSIDANGVVSFGGTATGNIMLTSFTEASFATTGLGTITVSRGGVSATLEIVDVDNQLMGITLTADQNFYILYSEADGATISGDGHVFIVGEDLVNHDLDSWTAFSDYNFSGITSDTTLVVAAADVTGETIDFGSNTVEITALDEMADADLSQITAADVTADSAGDVTFTGNLGSAAVTVSSGSFLININATLGTSTFSVSSGATLNADDGMLNGVTVTGAGTTTANLTDNINLSHVLTPVVTGIVYQSANISANVNLGTVTGYVVGMMQYLTMTAAQADGLVVSGPGGGVIISGSAGDQVLDIQANSFNTITAGVGADQITLGAGTDTVVIAGASAGTAEVQTLTFGAATSTGNITVGGQTVAVIAGDTAIQVAGKVQTAINTVVGASSVDNGDGTVTVAWAAGTDEAVVSFADTGTTGVTFGTNEDTKGVAVGTVSDSAPGYLGVAHTIDTITGFDTAADKLQLSGGTAVLANGSYTVGSTTITVVNGVVTATSQTDGNMLISELLTQLGSTTDSVAFNAGADTYVIQGDGAANGQISDIVVKLADTNLTNLSDIFDDITAPTLMDNGWLPYDNDTNVPTDNIIILPFNESINPLNSDMSKVYLKDVTNDTTVPADITVSYGKVVINPASNLTNNTDYYVTWDAGALKDAAGNAVTAVSDETTFNFTTNNDATAPLLTGGSFEETGDTDGITLYFTESMSSPATGTAGFTASKNGSNPITLSKAKDYTPGKTVAFASTTGLASTDYVTIDYDASTGGITDDVHNPFASSFMVIGGSGANTIDLSSAATSAIIFGNGGADTITGSSQKDLFAFAAGDSTAVTVDDTKGSSITTLDATDTFTFADGVADVIVGGFTTQASGTAENADTITFINSFKDGLRNLTDATLSNTTGTLTDETYILVRGGLGGGVFTVAGAGADTLIVYDGDASNGVAQHGIVLTGVLPDALTGDTGTIYLT